MSAAIGMGVSLAAISFMVAGLLIVAWLDFGRPAHALTWSIAFALFGISWMLALVTIAIGTYGQLNIALLTLPALGTALTSYAFYQRAGKTDAWQPLLIMTGVALTAGILLLWSTGSFSVAGLPYTLLNAVCSWYASNALVGRRQGERAAERLTLYWLRALAIVFLLLFVARLFIEGDGRAGLAIFRFAHLDPILPAVLTGIGLFAVFLLTADLADQSRRLAGTDMLTGLLNRRGFEDAAKALIGSARRNDRALCLAVIDVDRFKEVNDRFGHLAGDEVLRRFGTCLSQQVGPRDILARIGGEEFALMLADRDCATARTLLDGVREAIASCALDLPDDHRVTASFGVAPLGVEHDLDTLFGSADDALYLAKAGGRNRVIVAD